MGIGGDQWGSRVLLMRPVAVGKKLFLCCEVLVLKDRNLLPEGRDSKSLCLGWEGSTTILPAHLRVLEVCRFWREPIAFSAWLSGPVSEPPSPQNIYCSIVGLLHPEDLLNYVI